MGAPLLQFSQGWVRGFALAFGNHSPMPMKQPHGNIRPELPKHIGKHIPADRESILARDPANRPRLTRVISQRNTLSDSAPQNLGSIESRLPVIIRCNNDARNGITKPLQKAAPSQRIVALILMEDRRQREEYKVIA